MTDNTLKIAALADIHVRSGGVSYQDIFSRISQECDVLLLCGDLTQHGLVEEAELLVKDLASCKVPVLAVFGNHDHDKQQHEQIKDALIKSRVVILSSSSYEFRDVGFVGTKGFCGGFEKYMLTSFGEEDTKVYVQAAVNESMRLEKMLTNLTSSKKVVVLHYAPIRETLMGEPLELYPFLGCSRLLEPIERYGADVVFHGHAHHGTFHATTPKGIPVYNVSYPVLKRQFPDRPYFVYEL